MEEETEIETQTLTDYREQLLSNYFAELGKKGGKNRWKKVNRKDRSAHGRKMALAMHKKKGHRLSPRKRKTA